jgi:hypothetical protein
MKVNQCNKKMKLEKREPHFIIDPDFIALMEYMKYMQNTEFNPGPALVNKPVFTQGQRFRAAPHFHEQRYAPIPWATGLEYLSASSSSPIIYPPKHGNNRFALDQIFKVRTDITALPNFVLGVPPHAC